MANLTITKISDGFFDFQDENGNNFGGNDITYSYYNTDLKFNQYVYRLEEISYNNGTETIGFASVQECILALKAAGFTGNFNSGGASPLPYQEVNGRFYYNGSDTVTFTPIESTPSFDVTFVKFADGKYGWSYAGDLSKVFIMGGLSRSSGVYPRIEKDIDYPIELKVENYDGTPWDSEFYTDLKIQIFN